MRFNITDPVAGHTKVLTPAGLGFVNARSDTYDTDLTVVDIPVTAETTVFAREEVVRVRDLGIALNYDDHKEGWLEIGAAVKDPFGKRCWIYSVPRHNHSPDLLDVVYQTGFCTAWRSAGLTSPLGTPVKSQNYAEESFSDDASSYEIVDGNGAVLRSEPPNVDPFDEVLDEIKELNRSKRSDYASDESPWQNFIDSAYQTNTTPGQVVETLIAVKQSRLRNLLQPGKEAKNESVADTIFDLGVYRIISSAMYRAGLYEEGSK